MKNNGLTLFIKDINSEINKIDVVIKNIIELDQILKGNNPDKFHIVSFAGFINNFYTGIEMIFIRIAKKIDKDIPTELNWHKDLLNRMNYETDYRTSIISKEMKSKLLEYLNFRYFFRHSYTYELDWRKLKPLVKNAEKMFISFKNEIKTFLENFDI